MSRMFLLLLLITNLFCGSGFLHADLHQGIGADSSTVIIRSISPEIMAEYAADPAFDYSERQPADNIFSRFMDWLSSYWNRLMSMTERTIGNEGVQFVLVLIALGIAIYVLSGSEMGGVLQRREGHDSLKIEELDQNIHQVDFEELIRDALRSRNYRLAIRLYHLDVLKQLSRSSLIDLQPQKTNAAYARELASSDLRPGFAELTRLFEYVWYGNRAVSEAALQRAAIVHGKIVRRLLQPKAIYSAAAGREGRNEIR